MRTKNTTMNPELVKQNLSAEVATASGMLSPERMRIVLESLRGDGILGNAASKAGIHRKTLEYWMKRSRAGDAGYDIEWDGVIWSFHEHCEAAFQEANDELDAYAWYIAMDAELKDEDGKPLAKASFKQMCDMIRFILERKFPDQYGKHRKIDVPQNSGVLVVGGTRPDIPKKVNNGPAASARARKLKAGWGMIQKMKIQ